jgi:hypothetical protein
MALKFIDDRALMQKMPLAFANVAACFERAEREASSVSCPMIAVWLGRREAAGGHFAHWALECDRRNVMLSFGHT